MKVRVLDFYFDKLPVLRCRQESNSHNRLISKKKTSNILPKK